MYVQRALEYTWCLESQDTFCSSWAKQVESECTWSKHYANKFTCSLIDFPYGARSTMKAPDVL